MHVMAALPLKQQLLEDMKTAMKAHDATRLGVIRFVISLVKNFEIDHGPQEDAGVVKIIQTEIKKTKDAMADFQRAGRQDLVDAETEKVAVMEAYMPKQLSDEELLAIVQHVKQASGETHQGKLTGLIMKEVQGKADGGRVAAMIQRT
jgi:uncharacterized protein YqeY